MMGKRRSPEAREAGMVQPPTGTVTFLFTDVELGGSGRETGT